EVPEAGIQAAVAAASELRHGPGQPQVRQAGGWRAAVQQSGTADEGGGEARRLTLTYGCSFDPVYVRKPEREPWPAAAAPSPRDAMRWPGSRGSSGMG